uniref:Uncharacterized protein n=1 Tax=Anguilla anguilla TaxID=7936 RepID=A0A0E9XJ49_ANGAN
MFVEFQDLSGLKKSTGYVEKIILQPVILFGVERSTFRRCSLKKM